MKNQTEISYIVSERLQVFLMVGTLISLFFIFYFPYITFRSQDTLPPVISLTPQQLFELGGSAKPIDVGLFITSFSKFDIVKGDFLVDLTIWFKFNPDFVSLDQISKFVFQRAEIKHKSMPIVKIEGNDFVASYDMRVLFHVSLNYKDFPLDDHRLSFILDNNVIPASQAFFLSSKNNIVVSRDLHVEGWDLIDTAVEFGYFGHEEQVQEEQKTAYYSRAVFAFDFKETGVRYIISTFLPILMIFFMALFSFSIDPVESGSLGLVGMSGSSLAALIAFRFVMEAGSPITGYFMLSDYIFLFYIVLILLIFLIHILGRIVTGFQKSMIVIFLHMLTIAVFLYLLAPWE